MQPDQALVLTRTQLTAYRLSAWARLIPFAFAAKHPIQYMDNRGVTRRMRWSWAHYTGLYHDESKPFRKGGLLSVFAGVCNIAIVIHDNLVVFDYETRPSLNSAIQECVYRGIAPYVVYSGSGLGGHIYFYIAEGAVNSIPHNPENRAVDIPDLEIRARGEVVLSEGSVHPDTGALYTADPHNPAQPPNISIHEVDWLSNRNGEPIKLTLATGHGKPRKPNPERAARIVRIAAKQNLLSDERLGKLNNPTLDYLEQGQSLKGTRTRNTRLSKAALEFNGCGFSYTEATRILGGIAAESGLKPSEITNTLKSAYRRERQSSREYMAVQRPETVSATRARPDYWLYALAFASTHAWNKRTCDQQVFTAIAERSFKGTHDGLGVRASEREIAEAARVNRKSAHRSIKRLQAAGLIEPVLKSPAPPAHVDPRKRDTASGALLWRFTDDVVVRGRELLKSSPLLSSMFTRSVSSGGIFNTSDTHERGGLGVGGTEVYRALLRLTGKQGAVAPKDLVAETGQSRNQVNYALKKLLDVQLAVKSAKGYIGIPETDDQIASTMGTAGKGARRREKHAVERAIRKGLYVYNFRLRHDRERFIPVDVEELTSEPDSLLALAVELGAVVVPLSERKAA